MVIGPLQAFISLEGIVDIEAERARLEKALADARGFAESTERKLANKEFIAKAPEAVVAKERAKAQEAAERMAKLSAQLDELG